MVDKTIGIRKHAAVVVPMRNAAVVVLPTRISSNNDGRVVVVVPVPCTIPIGASLMRIILVGRNRRRRRIRMRGNNKKIPGKINHLTIRLVT